MPGVQKPHCTAPCATKDFCTAWASGSRARPSMVVSSRPSQSTANSRQELTERPSTMMVQAPHSPSPQPYLVPVRPTTSRSNSSVLMPAPTRALCFTPLSVKRISVLNGMAQHPFRHVVQQLLAVPGAGPHVVDGLGFGRGGPRGGLGQRVIQHLAF